MKFILIAANSALNEFRLAEIESIATLFNFNFSYPDQSHLDITRPYLVIDLPSQVEANLLGSRLIGIKSIWEHWGDAQSYQELHQIIQSEAKYKTQIADDMTWKFTITTYSVTLSQEKQLAIIESFAYMHLLGPIQMKNPRVDIGVFEEYPMGPVDETINRMRRVFMGRRICGTRRNVMMEQYDLKKRAYIGNTSMEAEVSLLMANQSLAAPGKLVYDPFAGTGSLLLVSAAFGAMTFGSDIDGRQLRGKTVSINDSAQQYHLTDRLLDCFVFDITQHPFRSGEIFDAIITDPPYGVRAGAKRLGRRDRAPPASDGPYLIPGREAEGPAHTLPGYNSPQRPWEMTEVIQSLITFARYLLKPKGRLVFFLPTEKATYNVDDIPRIEGMRIVSNSLQDYGSWGRRLITIEKIGDIKEERLDRGIDRNLLVRGVNVIGAEGHRDFREKYMAGFKLGQNELE